MLISYKNGQAGIILRIKIPNTSKTDNSGVTGLTNTTPGLLISTIADTESTPTVYSYAGGTIQNITTLGVFAAPSSGECRFREVDNTNHPGVYEVQLDNARYAVSGAKSLLITLPAIGLSNTAQVDVLIPLLQDDPYVAKPSNYSLLSIDSSGHLILQPTGLDQVTAYGYTARQAIFIGASGIFGKLTGLPASPLSVTGLDGTTALATVAFDTNNNRLSSTITPP